MITINLLLQSSEKLLADISKAYWMASQKSLANKGPNDLAPVKAPIKLQFLHTDNATLLMGDVYRAKILAEKVILL